MPSDVDKLKGLIGKKVKDIKIDWDGAIDDFRLETIEFEDGTVLELWTKGNCVLFFLDKYVPSQPEEEDPFPPKHGW